MITNFIKKRQLGQLNNNQNQERDIANYLIEKRNIVKLRQYSFLSASIDHPDLARITIDSSGQYLLNGATQINRTFRRVEFAIRLVNLNSSNQVLNEELQYKFNWGLGELWRLQWIPRGNNLYAVSTAYGVHLYDSNTTKLFWDLTGKFSYWSDWHPNDPNLIANCGETLELFDIRTEPLVTGREEDYYDSKKTIISRCLWSTNNDNHLIIAKDNCISIYDKRNQSRMPIGYQPNSIHYTQITPNGKYLFGYDYIKLHQWEFSGSNAPLKHVREYLNFREKKPDDPCKSFGCEYYLTDKHIFLPLRVPTEIKNEPGKWEAVKVFNIETGKQVNLIRCDGDDYDDVRLLEMQILSYERVDAITGFTNNSALSKLYTMKGSSSWLSYEVCVWSLSGGSQDDTDVVYVDLEMDR